jgi:hypothetical protein
MKPGGYLQFADIEFSPRCDDATMPHDTIFKKWEQAANAFRKATQRRFIDAHEIKKEMEDAGFVEIQERRYKLPVGAWSSDPKYRDVGRVSRPFSATSRALLTVSCVVIRSILGDRNGGMDHGSCNGVS